MAARPPTTAASATPGVGDGAAGLPFPHVASRQFSGAESGASATCTISVPALSVPLRAPCGTRPPMTAAARIATRHNRHVRAMGPSLRVLVKPPIRTTGHPDRWCCGGDEVGQVRRPRSATPFRSTYADRPLPTGTFSNAARARRCHIEYQARNTATNSPIDPTISATTAIPSSPSPADPQDRRPPRPLPPLGTRTPAAPVCGPGRVATRYKGPICVRPAWVQAAVARGRREATSADVRRRGG